MTHLIDKDSIAAEIEKKIQSIHPITEKVGIVGCSNVVKHLREVLSFIDTLEVKEVDNIWHDANETPKGAGDKEILVQFADSHASVLEIDDWEYLDHQTKWAYLKDLM